MKVIKSWEIGGKTVEIVHETGKHLEKGHWELRVDGEVRMYGTATPRRARQAVMTRRNLAYLG